ncbi:deferrochelatase/peroxidase EfeB [Antricoccus suffuscus]|uniref:Deferrochelatase n=1 Tax=Antricoccus suffuscus TaxID=1629062 RepID=A0A2T0ZRX1_9ACTN|nr:iron uptake transporter deferrochelatase/peroxidase subunit [Antricoccus suffuscus]PRZ39099.1 deferrochelatase/peroxidase EfeB [Antricoccus suffuscus]
MTHPEPDGPPAHGPSRRRFLTGAGLLAAGVAGGAVAGGAAGYAIADDPAPVAKDSVPFYGQHQAGISTAAQDRLMFAALDITATDPKQVALMLGRWSAMAARFCAGEPVTSAPTKPSQPPLDTGETMGLPASNLTITVGFGPSMFDDRFGLTGKMPAALKPLEVLPGSSVIDPAISDGDLCIQACADDPQVVFHAVRNMVRAARGTAVLRWSQLGFGRASATGAGQSTPRNLFGFKDGTNNIHADNATALDDYVWVGNESDQDWMAGGSYLVARKIRMEIESWDADFLSDQERIFGRDKSSGAPLTGKKEFDTIDFGAKGDNGKPIIDVNSHIRLAAPEQNIGTKLLRRGYNYTDGQHPGTGKLDAGLFFICFQKDPRSQFAALQTKLGKSDLLNEYITHVGSGLWACPPGLAKAGDWYGKSLFAGQLK